MSSGEVYLDDKCGDETDDEPREGPPENVFGDIVDKAHDGLECYFAKGNFGIRLVTVI